MDMPNVEALLGCAVNLSNQKRHSTTVKWKIGSLSRGSASQAQISARTAVWKHRCTREQRGGSKEK
ncbi:hypothetical protein N7491_010995 [Penicillium cf. griseofulvum]|uniref:Uncharacterized protein n=1 Tax=Penicillium cf. griseofulvum TaxID=2972120 RepID=A0A9W9T7A4_9EURO|nr:hypothetical protein N7472_001314 [Penicillium cf. griseofulvum]KAJ5422550.1 hypothetical protein N7491_010995 [Penicillium cf. griseofulvum]KAJ5428727.1 hypothetical protein N7445_010181 [Penicillium cf. griseofulvum]